MDDTYKGDSPSKKFARWLYWSSVAKLTGARFRGGKHLVLASGQREGRSAEGKPRADRTHKEPSHQADGQSDGRHHQGHRVIQIVAPAWHAE